MSPGPVHKLVSPGSCPRACPQVRVPGLVRSSVSMQASILFMVSIRVGMMNRMDVPEENR